MVALQSFQSVCSLTLDNQRTKELKRSRPVLSQIGENKWWLSFSNHELKNSQNLMHIYCTNKLSVTICFHLFQFTLVQYVQTKQQNICIPSLLWGESIIKFMFNHVTVQWLGPLPSQGSWQAMEKLESLEIWQFHYLSLTSHEIFINQTNFWYHHEKLLWSKSGHGN